MAENRKHILDKFEKHLYNNYKAYCKRHGVMESLPDFITFLIDQELIQEVTIKRYTVLKEFNELYPLEDHHKTRTVNTLSDKFNIPERTVWGILKYGEQFSNKKAVK